MKNRIIISILSISVLLIFVSCASIDQKVSIAPVNTKFPVSGSQSLYVNNKVIDQASFTGSEKFAITEKYSIPLSMKDSKIDIEQYLNKEIENTNYKGIIQLGINVNNIDSSTIQWISFEREMGALCASLGGAYFIISQTYLSQESQVNYIPGIVLLGAGAVFIGGSFIHEKFGSVDYELNLTGVKVSY